MAAVLFSRRSDSPFRNNIFSTGRALSIPKLITFNLYRVLGGIGVGLASAVAPMYISEISRPYPWELVSFNQFAIIFGMLVVYFRQLAHCQGTNSGVDQ